MSADKISLPQPYFVPGYTGFCPQFKYRSGHTYGRTTHKLLLDPSISHAEHLILSEFADDNYEILRHPMMIKNVEKDDIKSEPLILEHPITSAFAAEFAEQGEKIRPELLFPMLPSTIYPLHIAQIPNYAGHIPGGIFRYGKTFGNNSRDCKRWLCGDYSN